MGFIVAALVIAVLFADRLGPPGEVRRRFYQVGLAVSLAVFVSAVAAFLTPARGLEALSPSEVPGPIAESLRERQTLIVGLALLLIVAGVVGSLRWQTLFLGVTVGGVLTLLQGLGDPSAPTFLTLLYDTSSQAGTARNLLYAVVLGVGVVVLLVYGYDQWERQPAASESTPA